MSRTTRDTLKRRTAQVYFDIDRAMQGALELRTLFDPVHPVEAAILSTILDGLLLSQNLLARFWEKAWGQEKPNWQAWL
jgi:hypothetical protein